MRSAGAVSWGTFGERLEKEIEKTGLSYRDLAEELDGPAHSTLHRICKGDPCSVELYLWLCEHFSIDPMWAYRKKT
jgi:hypothetical protein